MRLVFIGFWVLLLCGPAHATSTAIDFARSTLMKSDVVDFDRNGCRFNIPTDNFVLDKTIQELKPNPSTKRPSTSPWLAACRTINGKELLKILSSQVDGKTVELRHVYIIPDPDPDMPVLKIDSPKINLQIDGSYVGGRLDIDGSYLESLHITKSIFDGAFNAENVNIGREMIIQKSNFDADLDITSLTTGSYLQISDFGCGKCGIEAKNLDIGGNFYMEGFIGDKTDTTTKEKVSTDFSNCQFRRSVYFKGVTEFMTVDCKSCMIEGNLYFQSDDNPLLEDEPVRTAFMDHVDFSESDIVGDVDVSASKFSDFLMFDNSSIDNFILESNSILPHLIVRGTSISGSFLTAPPLIGVTIGELDFDGSTVGKQIDLSGFTASSWSTPPPSVQLDLSDVKTGSFTNCTDSFPDRMKLGGFTYDNFHQSFGQNYPNNKLCLRDSDPKDMLKNPVDQIYGGNLDNAAKWSAWLRKSTTTNQSEGVQFDPQPYVFLAKTLAGNGDFSRSNAILLDAKEDETRYDLSQGDHLIGHWLFFLWLVAGYGIGEAAVFHLIGTIAVSILLGFCCIWFSRQARDHGVLWCIGACLERLLPVIELNQEFKDFFDKEEVNKACPRLTGLQKFIFAIYSLWGWFIGFLVLAVMGGLTQGS